MAAESSPPEFINRELSWLEFNQRVLDEALDPEVPLLERLKFLAITASNLDEFFMVRVAGVQSLVRARRRKRDESGLTPLQQLKAVSERAHRMAEDQYRVLGKELEPRLAEVGFRRLHPGELTTPQATHLEKVFEDSLFPVVSPLMLDMPDQVPLLRDLAVLLLVRLEAAGDDKAPRYAVLPVGVGTPRFVTVPADGGSEHQFITIEDLARLHVHRWFPGRNVEEAVAFRITRNADIELQEDAAFDLVSDMIDVLEARKLSRCVRLQVESTISAASLSFLRTRLEVSQEDLYALDGPLQLKDYMGLCFTSGFADHQYPVLTPVQPPEFPPDTRVFDVLAQRDVLLCHPYDQFDPVVRFVEEAAEDPGVLAIKQILYRVTDNSPIVAALMRAARRGKSVTALVELKARFDEARNIEWAQVMEQAGVQVIYGVRGLKTHAKICIVVRREASGVRRYMHFGTGNYNEKTATLYTDVSYLTANEDLGADASAFFNAICGLSEPVPFRKLAMSPKGVRDTYLDLIEAEIQRKQQGRKARILFKCNSLQDPELIQALYRASQAGVKIKANVRGICCLRPGVKGLSENIEVVRVVDRFLEHARIAYFHHGGEPRMFISSADWMTRNLDKRVELMTPVDDEGCRKYLLEILETGLADTVKGRRLLSDGGYTERKVSRKGPVHSQLVLYAKAVERARSAQDRARTRFEPVGPPGADG